MEFNQYIRNLRLEKRLSQVELAEMANIKTPYLSKIESGKEPAPSEAVLIRLAAALNEDPYWMIVKGGKVPNDFKDIIIQDEQVYNYIHRKIRRNKSGEEGTPKYEQH